MNKLREHIRARLDRSPNPERVGITLTRDAWRVIVELLDQWDGFSFDSITLDDLIGRLILIEHLVRDSHKPEVVPSEATIMPDNTKKERTDQENTPTSPPLGA